MQEKNNDNDGKVKFAIALTINSTLENSQVVLDHMEFSVFP
jgi:hypothetical protein